MLVIAPEGPLDGPSIDLLLDQSFGRGRFRKISYRYRLGIAPLAGLCLVARAGSALVGSIRYWPVRLGTRPALLLGPLAIAPDRQGQGIGRSLVRASLELAEAAGWRRVFLVGDPAYYVRHGFAPVPANIVMPGEDQARLQVRLLGGAALPPAGGVLLRARGPGLLGAGIEIGEDGLTHQRQALVGGHAGLELAQALGHGKGYGRIARHLGERADQGADGERHGTAHGQAAQGLPLDA